MKTSEILELSRDLNAAIDVAGKGEFRWFMLATKLDELGYDVTKRQPSTKAILAAVEACATIADTVEEAVRQQAPNGALSGTPDPDRLFAD